MTELTGKHIGRYEIMEKIGEGGMASVYRSIDPQTKQMFAIKVLRNERGISEKFLKRFKREAKTLTKLKHDHIIPVIDHGDFEELPYLVMPYLSGGTFKRLLGKPIPYAVAAAKLEVVAEALAYAHDHGVIHRDVKPSNILLDEAGQPFLSDFGIAKLIDTEETSELTGTGIGVGTPEYISPEQALGKQVDGRTDCYSLGIVFYEMVTGRKPFIADTPLALAIKQATDPLPNPRQFIGDLPEKVELVLVKSLAKDPEKRYQSMHQFAEDLHELASGNLPIISSVRSLSTRSKKGKFRSDRQIPNKKPRTRKTVFILAGILLTSIIAATVTVLMKPDWMNNLLSPKITEAATINAVSITEANPTDFSGFKACYLTAVGDSLSVGSYSGIGWAGVQKAVEDYGISTDIKTPIRVDELPGILEAFVQEGCSIIISSEYSEVELMQQFAKANPDIYFAMNECTSVGNLKNARCGQFETKYAALLAGFLACGYSQNGEVGTFGGGDYASINNQMQGFGKGVEFFNFMMDKNCKIDGWFSDTSSGTYIYNMVYPEKAKNFTQNLLTQGADVIFPVARTASSGALDAVTAKGNAYVIGVDLNWAEVFPEKKAYILASIVSHVDAFVYDSIERAMQQKDFNSSYEATLENNGVEFIIGADLEAQNDAAGISDGIERAKSMIALAKTLNVDPLAISYEQLQVFIDMQMTPSP